MLSGPSPRRSNRTSSSAQRTPTSPAAISPAAISPAATSPAPGYDCKTPDQDGEFQRQAEAAALAELRRATAGSGLHSAGIQVKDLQKSKWFYTHVLGMEIIKETENGSATMLWLAFPNPADAEEEGLEFGQRRGLLQLVHVAGSESEQGFRIVHGVPGFCHFCVNVTDLDESMQRYKAMGVNIVEEGNNEQGFGAISDPDGYTIQLLYCQIDQSLALKKQVEEMMSIGSSSASLSARRPSSSSRGNPRSLSRERQKQNGSQFTIPSELSTLTRSSTANSQGATNGGPDGVFDPSRNTSRSSVMPELSTFRGGSPDFNHPHWQNEYDQQQAHNALAPTTSTTDASDDEDDKIVPGPRSRRPSHSHPRHDEYVARMSTSNSHTNSISSDHSLTTSGRTPRPRQSSQQKGEIITGGVVPRQRSVSPHTTMDSNSRHGSFSAPMTALTSSSTMSDMSRSRSGSIFRPNAPKSIDLRALQLEAQQNYTPDTAAAVVADAKAEVEADASRQGVSVDVVELPSGAEQADNSISLKDLTSSSSHARKQKKKDTSGSESKRFSSIPLQRHNSNKSPSSSSSNLSPLKATGSSANNGGGTRSVPHGKVKSRAHAGLRSFRDRFSFVGGSSHSSEA
ncbi:unnamed protein product [Sympodiomycopsis kandeliae]